MRLQILLSLIFLIHSFSLYRKNRCMRHHKVMSMDCRPVLSGAARIQQYIPKEI